MSSIIRSTDNQNIVIKSTEETPKVEILLNENMCSITGNFHCVDPAIFFSPLMRWARDFTSNYRTPLVVKFYFTHINSASVSYLLKFIRRLIAASLNNKSAIVFKWYFDRNDIEMEELISDFNDILGGVILPVRINQPVQGVVLENTPTDINSGNITDRIFKSVFSKKYDRNVIVFNPFFFFSNRRNNQ